MNYYYWNSYRFR